MLITLLMPFIIGSVSAQNSTADYNEKSVIVVPKDVFLEVLSKAVTERRKEMSYDNSSDLRIRLLKAQLEAKRRQMTTLNPTVTNSKVSSGNKEFDEKFYRLEDQIRELMLLVNQQGNPAATQPNIVLPNRGNSADAAHSQLLSNLTPVTNAASQEATPTDSLSATNKTIVVDNTAIEQELSRLVEETAHLKDKIKHNQKLEKKQSEYAGVVKEIFFANNKINLSSEAIATIDQVVSILKSNSNLEIMIKGFASKKGNPVYNNDLSLKRSDNVKKAFITKGIAPGRVMTTYHGEDYSNRSEAASRRVDIIILDSGK